MGITLIESAANNWKIVPMQQHYYGSIIIYLLLAREIHSWKTCILYIMQRARVCEVWSCMRGCSVPKPEPAAAEPRVLHNVQGYAPLL
jgi:hypothetical protein